MEISCILSVAILLLVAAGNTEHHLTERLDFIQEPTDTHVLSFVKEVPLHCEASSPLGHITYKWMKKENDGTVRIMSETDEIEIRNGSLVFKAPSVKNEYNGIYQCEVENEEGLLLSREAKLTYADLNPTIIPNTIPIRAVENSWVVINCPLTEFSLPDISYTWLKNTEVQFVDPDSMDTFVSLDGNLYFSDVKKTHAGNYSCNTMFRKIEGNGIYLGDPNTNSKMSQQKTLTVLEEDVDEELQFDIVPNFPKVFPSQPKLKQTVDFECVAYGSLPIEYSWKHNDEDVVNNTKFTDRVQFSEGNRRMKISDLMLMDEGNYSCIATNGVNETYRYLTLDVEGVPVFSVKPADHTALTNSFLKLNCLVYDPASPKIHWLKNGIRLKNISKEIFVGSDSLILFTPTIGRDDGIYQCSATNIFGSVYASAQVQVQEVKPTSGSQILHSKNILLPIVLLYVLLCIRLSWI